MESLAEKRVMVVQKVELLDPEDFKSLVYEVSFVVMDKDFRELDEPHTKVTIHTDDCLLFDKFKVGKEADLKFLEVIDEKAKSITKAKAN